jgi:hypothetical protein
MRLARQRNFDGADVIVMSEHVDYWNYLGWKDPFSARQFTDRQNEYARAFGGADVYTPQIIVDGKYNVLGSNYAGVTEAIFQASRKSKGSLAIGAISHGNSIEIQVTADPVSEATIVYLGVTEDNLANNVSRGENKGKKLSHFGVVRQLTVLGSTKANARFTADHLIKLAPDWKVSALHAFVFTQSAKSHSILALSEIPLTH